MTEHELRMILADLTQCEHEIADCYKFAEDRMDADSDANGFVPDAWMRQANSLEHAASVLAMARHKLKEHIRGSEHARLIMGGKK